MQADADGAGVMLNLWSGWDCESAGQRGSGEANGRWGIGVKDGIFDDLGSNARGQLGNGSTDDFTLSFNSAHSLAALQAFCLQDLIRVISVSGGANHTVLLLEIKDTFSSELRTELWGCGSSSRGQLGTDIYALPNASSPVFRLIHLPLEQHNLMGYSYKIARAAWETTYAVLRSPGKEDVLISMGADDFGDLGVGDHSKDSSVNAFHIVNFDHIKVDGLRLKSDTIEILDLSTGQHHVVAHLRATFSDDSARSFVVGWGISRHGQLGDVALDSEHNVMQRFIPTPRLVLRPGEITELSLGAQHTIFLHASRRVSGIGSNRKGQFHVRHVACTWNGTYNVVDDEVGAWRIISLGSNTHGQLGRISTDGVEEAVVDFPNTVKAWNLERIVSGSEHVLCLTSAKTGTLEQRITEVWGWGWNEHGNLGLNTTDDAHAPVKLWPAKQGDPYNIIDIWAGCGTSWLYALSS
ncbi:regulator of chromosome condensation 1/beta-lactamase-inhibitor protein II [Amanita rubescens]|nr:regulator of chromosome condensation 1/beta-lactamase-inhibitor protein II [Amanita rubescens]